MRNNRQVALILADIDRFGEVNRTFGVEVGDAILAAIARHLRQIASADTGIDGWDVNTACRIGGEELALIVPEVARGVGDRTPLEHRAYAVAETPRVRSDRSTMPNSASLCAHQPAGLGRSGRRRAR